MRYRCAILFVSEMVGAYVRHRAKIDSLCVAGVTLWIGHSVHYECDM